MSSKKIIFKSGADIAAVTELDRKRWYALSMPVAGVRFDHRTLELMDSDGDGYIRTPEVMRAIEFLKENKVDFKEVFTPVASDERKLADVMDKQSDLAKLQLTEEDQATLAAWEQAGKEPSVAILGDRTASAEVTLAAVEPIIDGFFTPPEDMPLVTEEPDRKLPLTDHLNPRYLEPVIDFAAQCVTPILGERTELTRLEWKRVKAAFAPYRTWAASKPVVNAGAKGELVEQERLLRYKLHLREFLENFVNMSRLYSLEETAIFQTGILRLDARDFQLCFHVDSEAAHSALAGKSNCCVVYAKLTRPTEKLERSVCAVVTAGTVAGLYVGRNGVFYDRDGKDWAAVVTKVIEAQVSLSEAFWSPWRKLGEGLSNSIKKFLGDSQQKAVDSVQSNVQNIAKGGQAGGAALASSIAAVGIGLGMAGTAMAAIAAAVKGMSPFQLLLSLVTIVAVVSLPSVALSWAKLRKRDLSAILNASGWAINREMRFSMGRARCFTSCAFVFPRVLVLLTILIVVAAGAGCYWWCLYRGQI